MTTTSPHHKTTTSLKRPLSVLQLIFLGLTGLAAMIQFWMGSSHQGIHSSSHDHDIRDKALRHHYQKGGNKQQKESQNQYQNQPHSSITIYCILPYVWTPASRAKRIEILNTWGKRCNKIQFLIDPMVQVNETTYLDATNWEHESASSSDGTISTATDSTMSHTLPPDVHVIKDMTRAWHNCTNNKGKKADECRNIWEKVWRSFVYVHREQQSLNDDDDEHYDWYLKTDWDAYVFVDHIRQYVHQQSWNGATQHHFLGHQDLHKKNKPFISGALQIFSAKSFRALARTLEHMPKATPQNITEFSGEAICRDGAGLADFPTALCLKQGANVTAESTRDEEGRERVLLFPPQDLLTFNRTEQGEWWYWGGKPQDVGQMENCCSPLPLVFHARLYKDASAGHYYFMERELYDRQVPVETWDPNKYPKLKRRELLNTYMQKVKAAIQRENLDKLPPIQKWS